jgi:uncharacterized membrane protein
MVIMLLDHTREFVHADAFRYSPTDLSKTNVLVFFTRWITHLCAPTFVFLAGTSIYLQLLRGKSRPELSKFLLARGLWLIILEFTVIRFALFFNVDYRFLGLAEVIWVFGVSMIVLSALIFLPVRAVAGIGIVMIALHNLLDRVTVPPAVSMAGSPAPDIWQILWIFLHQPGFVPLSGNVKLFVAYPLIPWIGVMAAGYAFGVLYKWDKESRRRWLIRVGFTLSALFILSSAIITYRSTTQNDPAFIILDFFNATKYPPSLLFLLMTLGPALLILALAEKMRDDNFVSLILTTFGRVPLFYFILQMFVAHILGITLNYFAGKNIDYFFLNFPDSATGAPPDAGFPLWVVYAAWLAGVVFLYPLCRWYAEVKRNRRGFPFSYL